MARVKISQYHYRIIEARRNGEKQIDLAKEIGCKGASIAEYMKRNGLGGWRLDSAKPRRFSREIGKMPLRKELTADQLIFLDKCAKVWGTKTLAEVALELLRDKLEEEMER